METAEVQALSRVVRDACGLRIDPAKQAALVEPLRQVAVVQGFGSIAGLAQALAAGGPSDGNPAWGAVLPLVANNETYFFREPGQLDLFGREVLPLLASARPSGTLRILSAACSTGEEPYSLAMVAAESPATIARTVAIVGVDIDPVVIDRARSGIFGPAAFRATDSARRERWFRAENDSFRVSPALRDRVRFVQGNLLEMGRWPGFQGFDAIMCRNLLIYFDPASQERLVDILFSALTPGGVLLVGHAEGIPPLAERFWFRSDGRACYYRRPLDQTAH